MKPRANTETSLPAHSWPGPDSLPVAVAFFVLMFLYVWLRIEPSVDYQHSAPSFRLSESFFSPFLAYPGGLVDYGTALLTQLNHDDGLGALSFTAMGCLIYLATRKVLIRIRGVTPRIAPYGPVFVLLLLRDRYDFPSLAIGLGLLLALGLAIGGAMLPWTRAGLRLAACWVGSAVVFWVAGVWPCLLYGVLGGLFEVVRGRRWWLGLGCMASVLVVPLGMVFGADAMAAKGSNPWAAGMPAMLLAIVYLGFALAAVVLALVPSAPAPAGETPATRRSAWNEVWARRWFQTDRARRALGVGFFLLGWAAVWLGFDGGRKAVAQMDYFTSRGEYGRVLDAAAQVEVMDPASEVRLHLALYHTGRLGRDLFSFKNQTAWDLMPALRRELKSCRPQSETLLELGQVNLAEHFAHEALEVDGERPDVLRRLAQINVIKDRPKAARLFLNVLGQIPFEAAWVDAFRRDLEANPRLPDRKDLGEVRSRMVSADLAHSKVPTELVLRQLLEANRQNQMAFEYLMAHYLLTGQTDQIVGELGRLKDFGYAEIPRHYEEALVLHQQGKGSATPGLEGRQVRTETVRRFEAFSAAMSRRALDSAEGREGLARSFGDTYWYHGVSGRTASDQSAAHTTEQ